MEEGTETTISRTALRGVVTYSTPELATASSDVYSFATLMFECIAERTPLFDVADVATVVDAMVASGEYLDMSRRDEPNPKGCISDGLWDLMSCCWSAECDQRPTMEEVYTVLSSQA